MITVRSPRRMRSSIRAMNLRTRQRTWPTARLRKVMNDEVGMADSLWFEREEVLVPQTIAVIIATNRGGPYLAEAVESVRRQTRPVEEVVIVDDGAPAGELQRFVEKNSLRYVRSDGQGVSAARNAGAAATSADWLVFLDDDDVWHPDRIQEQLRALEGRAGTIASHTGGWYMDSDGSRFGVDWSAPSASSIELLRGDVPLPRITTLIVRHDAFDRIGGFCNGMRMGEDHDLILRLLMLGESAAVDRSLVGYRRHPDNVTSRLSSGRPNARRWWRRLRAEALVHGDSSVVEAIDENRRRTRRANSEADLGELIDAVRHHHWAYAARISWSLALSPGQTVRAVLRRARA